MLGLATSLVAGVAIVMTPGMRQTPGPPAESAAMATIWEIGTADGRAAEFALGIDDFHLYTSRFPDGPLFVVGRSEPRIDWAHVHPGPLDAWAGGRTHTFTVRFGCAANVRRAPGRVVVDLADAHRTFPPEVRVRVNDFVRTLPTAPGSADTLEQRPPAGAPQRLVFDLPPGALRLGDNTVAITAVSGCWLVYDRVALESTARGRAAAVVPETTIRTGRTRPIVRHGPDEGPRQVLRLVVEHAGPAAAAEVVVDDADAVPVALRPGRQAVDVPVVVATSTTPVRVTIRIDGKTVTQRDVMHEPVRPWVVHVLHHTHLDIGYTHEQAEVETLQWRHLDHALDLAAATDDHPDDARFRWNPEALWAVEGYLEQATPAQRERFVEAVRRGSIGLDALYSNTLTGLCRPEELFELTACARRLANTHDLTIDSAMITDIPGFAWGLVPALAHAGVRYLSVGPNRGHRIGFTLREWGDRPFYWESPSGAHRVLCWTAGKGYSWFHGTWKGADTFEYDNVETALDGDRIVGYLEELEHGGYPYELVQLRYNVGSDNGPPDPGLADFVRDWNEQYAVPRLVITTTSEMGRALEARYGDELPVFRGDFTPYWEDGAASSARETALNRAAAERLVQAATLWSLLDPAGFPQERFREAWRNVLLFSEHTWGSWNSVSEPDGAFTRRQWAVKRAFAEEADRRSRSLLENATATVAIAPGAADAVTVFNTCSWPRSDLVELPADRAPAGDLVRDEAGRPVPSQRLRSGALAFLARDVPGLGAARYTFHAGPAEGPDDSPASVADHRLANGRLAVELDAVSGAIRQLRHADLPYDLVNPAAATGLGTYLYVAGRAPDTPQPSGPARLEIVEPGPLVAVARLHASAPGCRALTREVRLVAGLDRVDLTHDLDKERVLEPEAVHVAFPFAVADPVVRLDVAWGQVELGRDQLPGACRNYFTVARGVDVSNDEHGVTLATVDTPLVEIGAITTDPTVVGWLEDLAPSATIYSYVMNNYWETNYCAAQEGPVRLRYSILPHGPFDATAAKRFGIERSQPLVAVPTSSSSRPFARRLVVEPASVMVTSLRPGEDGEATMVRLFNAGARPVDARLRWDDPAPASTWLSSPREDRLGPIASPLELQPWGIVTLRAEW